MGTSPSRQQSWFSRRKFRTKSYFVRGFVVIALLIFFLKVKPSRDRISSLKSRTFIVGRTFAPSTLVETQVVPRSEVFYVISLANVSGAAQSNNEQRLEQFLGDLNSSCHGHTLRLVVIPGHLDARRGAGLVLSFVELLTHAIAHDVERAYIFEDDAQLHNNLLCSSGFRQQLWDSVPDTLTLIFAAHHVVQHSRTWTPQFQFSALNESLGSYAWAIQRNHFSTLQQHWTKLLLSDKSDFSPDLDISRPLAGIHSHLLEFPPTASHRSDTFSNTWGVHRKHVFDKPPIRVTFIKRHASRYGWLQRSSQYMSSNRFSDKLSDHLGVDVSVSQHSSCTGYKSDLSSGLTESRFIFLIDADYANLLTQDVYDAYQRILAQPYSPHLLRAHGEIVIFAFSSAALQVMDSGTLCHEIFFLNSMSNLLVPQDQD